MDQKIVTIDPNRQMGELLAEFPGAKRALFAAYHIGGCSSCAYRDEESLAEVCQRNELDAAEVVETLKASAENDLKMLVDVKKAAQLIEEGVPVYDVRTGEEFEAVHLDGAIYLNQETEAQVMAEQAKEAPMLLCDHQGKHVLDRVAWFRGHGFEQCYGIKGGIDAWSREIDPSVRRYKLEFE